MRWTFKEFIKGIAGFAFYAIIFFTVLFGGLGLSFAKSFEDDPIWTAAYLTILLGIPTLIVVLLKKKKK
jgi:hypothetical protein